MKSINLKNINKKLKTLAKKTLANMINSNPKTITKVLENVFNPSGVNPVEQKWEYSTKEGLK